jgi:hypothetical protein
LAYRVMLARASLTLSAPKHSRETMVEFKQDWNVLQDARLRYSLASIRTVPLASNSASSSLTIPGNN